MKKIYNSKETNTAQESQTISPPGIEDIWVNVQVRKFKSIIVGAVYKHPNSSPECLKHLEHMLHTHSNKKKNMYVLGDINEDYLKTNKLKPLIKKYNLTQLIKEPTRITKYSQTLLDVIITNNIQSVINSETSLSIADHHAVSCKINLRKQRMKPFTVYSRNQENYSAEIFQIELQKSNYNFSQMYNTDNVEEQVKIFTKTFTAALDKCAPFKHKTIRRPPARWITNEIRQEIDLKNVLSKEYKNMKHSCKKFETQNQYNQQRTLVRKLINKAKMQYLHKQLKESRSDSKETWNIIKQIVPGKAKSNSCNFENPNEIAEKFNHFFAKVGEKTYKEVTISNPTETSTIENKSSYIKSNSHTYSNKTRNTWKPEPVTETQIIKAISKMKNTKAMGHDQIALQYIKHSLPVTIQYITLIINTSIVTKIFPKSWKHAIIIALHKSGETDDPSNFRPIHLLPILSKILEKAVAAQLMSYLETTNQLNPYQYAYRPQSSTEHALLNITEQIYTSIENGDISLLVLLDLSKAFDSVNHKKLISKLHNFQIETTWFENYLHARTHSVKTGKSISLPLENKYGVPQGSVLGPILFLIFINDIPNANTQLNKATTMTIYADDVQLLFTEKPNAVEVLKREAEVTLEHMSVWYGENGLKLNAKKTQCIIFGSPQNNKKITKFHITMNNTEIKMEDNVKNLGVWFDRNLSFKYHITCMCAKLNGVLSYLNRVKNTLDEKSRLLIVHALIFSSINYCSLIWGKCSADLQYQVQKCKNFAAKVVCKGKFTKRDHVTPLYDKLQWIDVYKTLFLQESTYVFNRLSIPQISNVTKINFQRRDNITNRSTRNSNDLYVNYKNTKSGTKAISVSGARIWNQIPLNIRNSTNIYSFTTSMIQHLADMQSHNEIS